MRWLGGQTSAIGRRDVSSERRVVRYLVVSLLVAAAAGGSLWLVWIYGNGLRDARYLDGWMLTGVMGAQLYFHISKKAAGFSPRAAKRWRSLHICLGYLLIALFISHCDFSLPDTAFEWALWIGFALVTLSGIFGTYLAWSLRVRGWIDESVGYERIPVRCAELAREVGAIVADVDSAPAAIALPMLPYDDWIRDLYAAHLRAFFQGHRNFAAHLTGSQRPLKRIMGEIDNVSRYVDGRRQQKLSVIKSLAAEKHRLDYARVHLGLSRAWLFVHVPVTYALIVLTILHIVVVYAYSSGLW